MPLFQVSGRFIIPGTRSVVTVKPVKMFFTRAEGARDSAIRQMIRPIEQQIVKEHLKDLPREGGRRVKSIRLTEQFLKMNLQVTLVEAAKKVEVPVPAIEVQTATV